MTTLAPGTAAILTIGRVPQGEFTLALRASSDGDKDLLLTQQRDDGRRVTLLSGSGTPRRGRCEGAAGSLYCGITTAASPSGHSWTFRLKNRSASPMSIRLTIAWRTATTAP